jgi:polyisoprenoid-binding protein YceI
MPRSTEADARCTVFTFKEGLLSAIAHDLEIAVERFHVEHDGAKVEARFDPASLRVRHALKDGAPSPSALSDRDRKKIDGNIRDEVLDVGRHREIAFASTEVAIEGDRATVKGTLTLHGRARPLEVHARRDGARWIADVTLHQPDYGITPYTAMMGTLRIKPDIRVRIELPA